MADIQLGNVLTKEAMILDHTPFNSKEEMFQLLSEKFFEAGVITNQQAYLTALREREAMGPTYMGNLIGLPHGRCDEVVKSGIAACDFDVMLDKDHENHDPISELWRRGRCKICLYACDSRESKCRSIHARIGNFSRLAGKRRICRSVGFGAQL